MATSHAARQFFILPLMGVETIKLVNKAAIVVKPNPA